jgi:hypothetical protein
MNEDKINEVRRDEGRRDEVKYDMWQPCYIELKNIPFHKADIPSIRKLAIRLTVSQEPPRMGGNISCAGRLPSTT